VQVREYAVYLGMEPDVHPELIFIAQYAMDAEIPAGWAAYLDANGDEYFHNLATGVSQYEHPLDEHYMQMYRDLVTKKAMSGGRLNTADLSQVQQTES
jgi:hypothetical protein